MSTNEIQQPSAARVSDEQAGGVIPWYRDGATLGLGTATRSFKQLTHDLNVAGPAAVQELAPIVEAMQTHAGNLTKEFGPVGEHAMESLRQRVGVATMSTEAATSLYWSGIMSEAGQQTFINWRTAKNTGRQLEELGTKAASGSWKADLRQLQGLNIKSADIDKLFSDELGTTTAHSRLFGESAQTYETESARLMKAQSSTVWKSFVKDMGALAGAQIANHAIDSQINFGAPSSLRTMGIDMVAVVPLMALNMNPWLKAASMVGIHVGARIWDSLDSK